MRTLSDIDNLLLEALDLLIRALTSFSRKLKLRKLDGQCFVCESQFLEIEALTPFVCH